MVGDETEDRLRLMSRHKPAFESVNMKSFQIYILLEYLLILLGVALLMRLESVVRDVRSGVAHSHSTLER